MLLLSAATVSRSSGVPATTSAAGDTEQVALELFKWAYRCKSRWYCLSLKDEVQQGNHSMIKMLGITTEQLELLFDRLHWIKKRPSNSTTQQRTRTIQLEKITQWFASHEMYEVKTHVWSRNHYLRLGKMSEGEHYMPEDDEPKHAKDIPRPILQRRLRDSLNTISDGDMNPAESSVCQTPTANHSTATAPHHAAVTGERAGPVDGSEAVHDLKSKLAQALKQLVAPEVQSIIDAGNLWSDDDLNDNSVAEAMSEVSSLIVRHRLQKQNDNLVAVSSPQSRLNLPHEPGQFPVLDQHGVHFTNATVRPLIRDLLSARMHFLTLQQTDIFTIRTHTEGRIQLVPVHVTSTKQSMRKRLRAENCDEIFFGSIPAWERLSWKSWAINSGLLS